MDSKNLLWKHSLPIIKHLFSRNRYECTLWIFLFYIDQAQICSADTKGKWSLNWSKLMEESDKNVYS